MRIDRGKSAALIIDIQEKLVPAMFKFERVLKQTQKLIIGLQELSVPLLVTQQYTSGLGNTVPAISTFISRFSFIEKKSFSCYDEPAFVEALEDLSIKHVIIAGIESHVCVLQTAIDLKSSGYEPVVVADCISSRSKSDLKIALKRLEQEGVIITSCESILFELTRTSGTPEFKNISKLLK